MDNPTLLKQGDALAAAGLKDRKVLEDLYPYIPQLIMRAYRGETTIRTRKPRQKVQPERRFVAEYMKLLGQDMQFRGGYTRDNALDFAASREARRTIADARSELKRWVASAAIVRELPGHENEALLTLRDFAHVLSVGQGTASDWCNETTGIVDAVRDGRWVYVPEDNVQKIAKWYLPTIVEI